MKHFYPTLINTFTLVLLTACAQSKPTAPSQNSALNSISPTKEKTDGWMQKSLDGWLTNEWEPTVAQDEKVQEKYMREKVIKYSNGSQSTVEYVEREDKGFTLQEYVDKAAAYMSQNKKSKAEESHADKIESMPVIGSGE